MAFLTHTPSAHGWLSVQRLSLFDIIAVRRQRRNLARLDDAALRDIGLTRDQAMSEARRPFWDVPGYWLK